MKNIFVHKTKLENKIMLKNNEKVFEFSYCSMMRDISQENLVI